MIELTTGVVFLLSSMYGAGHANANVANIASAADNAGTVSSIVSTTSAKLISKSEVEEYVRKEFADTPILIEVARCESGFNQYSKEGTVVRGRVNDKDVGVMQINEFYHAEDALKKNIDIYSVEGNVEFGKYLYSKYGTSAWSASEKCWSNELAKK